MDEAVAAQHETQVAQADSPRTEATGEQVASPGMLKFESLNESPVATASAPSAAQAANAAKIAALDKKTAKATAQVDMAEATRLMGERGLLLPTASVDF